MKTEEDYEQENNEATQGKSVGTDNVLIPVEPLEPIEYLNRFFNDRQFMLIEVVTPQVDEMIESNPNYQESENKAIRLNTNRMSLYEILGALEVAKTYANVPLNVSVETDYLAKVDAM